jgi:hypothetical protein
MTTSTALINRAYDHALDCQPESMSIIIELVAEYEIAVKQAIRLERILHEIIKQDEVQRGTE